MSLWFNYIKLNINMENRLNLMKFLFDLEFDGSWQRLLLLLSFVFVKRYFINSQKAKKEAKSQNNKHVGQKAPAIPKT